MKILITGGCGFLGSNLAAEALRRGDELIVLDNLSRQGSTDNLAWLQQQGEIHFIHADIRNSNDVATTVRQNKPDAIFHLAGQVAMTTSIANPRKDFEINALGTHNILEAVRDFSPETAILYSSTNKVYGDLTQFCYSENETRYVCNDFPDGFDEQVTLDFHSPYGCSKGCADQYMLDYARIFNLKTMVFRHSSMYGGRQFSTYDQGWIGWFCQQAIETIQDPSHSFTISGNGKQVRDVLHADDMISLYFTGLKKIDSARGNAFNIGGGIGNSLSLLELFNLLEKITGQKLNYTKLPPRESDQIVFVANHKKAQRLLGWQPNVSATDGIHRMVEWVRSLNEKNQ